MPCSSSDDNSSGRSAKTYYVSSATGDNTTGNGSSGLPYKSITYALLVAVDGDIVRVDPGTYDSTNGETFPIVVPAGVTVEGDTANQGAGGSPTTISGFASIGGSPIASTAAVLLGSGARLSGFTIVADTAATSFGLVIDGVNATASYNTYSGTYGGVAVTGASSATVSYSDIQTNSYGVYQYEPATPIIEHNQFSNAGFQVDGGGSGVIRYNTFSLNSFGIQFQGSSTAKVQFNTFTGGGARCLYIDFTSAPLIRSNTCSVSTGPGVQVTGNAVPDLGTAADPGGNTFTTGSGADLDNSGTGIVNAYGNTWTNNPPSCVAEITGTGTVYFGTGPSDNCP